MARRETKADQYVEPPASTPEGREQQLISLAVDLAEKQLREGTASTQVIVHYLKLGSSKERLEQQMLRKKTELVTAQADSIRNQERMDELYSEALKAMRTYGGDINEPEEELY